VYRSRASWELTLYYMDPEYGHIEISKPLKIEFRIAAMTKGMTMKEAAEIAVQNWMSDNGFPISKPR